MTAVVTMETFVSWVRAKGNGNMGGGGRGEAGRGQALGNTRVKAPCFDADDEDFHEPTAAQQQQQQQQQQTHMFVLAAQG